MMNQGMNHRQPTPPSLPSSLSDTNDPYRPPPEFTGRLESKSWPGVLVVAITLWSMLTMKVLFVRWFLISTVQEFEVTMPLVTRFLVHPMYPFFLLVTTLAIVVGGFRMDRQSSARSFGKIALLLGLITFFVTLLGSLLPLWQLVKALGS